MNVKLICQEQFKSQITTILKNNNFTIDENANILFIEQNMNYSSKYSLIICFDPSNPSTIVKFINDIKHNDLNHNMIIGKSESSFIPLEIESVVYFNSQGNYTYASLSPKDSYRVNYKLYQLEDILTSKCFIRINKSEIVNIKKIMQISPMLKGNFLVKLEGFKTPFIISRNYLTDFKERLGI